MLLLFLLLLGSGLRSDCRHFRISNSTDESISTTKLAIFLEIYPALGAEMVLCFGGVSFVHCLWCLWMKFNLLLLFVVPSTVSKWKTFGRRIYHFPFPLGVFHVYNIWYAYAALVTVVIRKMPPGLYCRDIPKFGFLRERRLVFSLFFMSQLPLYLPLSLSVALSSFPFCLTSFRLFAKDNTSAVSGACVTHIKTYSQIRACEYL